ncbi:MAG: NAD-dependent protein deacylase, partial [Myxococcales bacterium]
MTPELSAVVDAVAGHLRQARRVLAITGAGVSAESGLPTYR